jgi:LysM repeat protein
VRAFSKPTAFARRTSSGSGSGSGSSGTLRRALGLAAALWLTSALAVEAQAKNRGATVHTVKPGDTLYDLARRFGCTESELAKQNQVGELLPLGKKLKIPACGKPVAAKLPAGKHASGKRTEKPAEKVAGRPAALAKSASKPAGKAAVTKQLAAKPSTAKPAARLEPRGRLAAVAGEPSPRLRDRQRPELRRPAGRRPPSEASPAASASSFAAEHVVARHTAAALPSPPPAAAPIFDGPVTAPSIDPVTGSIGGPIAAAGAALVPVPLPIEEHPGDPPDDGGDGDDIGEIGLIPNLPFAELGTDGPSDHKLVLDGSRRPGPPGAVDLLPAPGEPPPITGQSVGLPWRGRLRDPDRLSEGEGYLLRRPHRTYGTKTTVAHVERALAELRQKFPRLHTLAIGDLSSERGGRISEHRSHQSGRDIDLGLCFFEKPEGYPQHFVAATEDTLDPGATWALVSALVDTAEHDGGLAVIFLDYGVQGILYRWALAEGVDQDRLTRIFQYPRGRHASAGLVRHAPNHADHIHARFRCASDETGCR